MKIGIITYWTSTDNYGQQLQCFALQRYLRLQGHDIFLIRYQPTFKPTSFWKKIYHNLSWKKVLYLLSTQREIDKTEEKRERELERINAQLNIQRDFENFRAKFIQSTPILYHSIDELRNNPPQADIYICGSDQVWNNPLSCSETAAWFLDFGDRKIKRISYAASIGRNLKKNELKRFKKYLSAFDAISVREESSRILCEKLGIDDVLVTLDPTLLLPVEEYRKIEKSCTTESNPYLFMYILNVATKEEIYWNAIDAYLHKSGLNLKIVCSSGYMQARELLKSYHNIQATLPEWLQYIDKANCVITTSFHGVVFCILMQKPFLVMLLTNKYAKGNDRIISLLTALHLSDRIYNPTLSIERQMDIEIDWGKVDQKISILKEKSYNFLNNI